MRRTLLGLNYSTEKWNAGSKTIVAVRKEVQVIKDMEGVRANKETHQVVWEEKTVTSASDKGNKCN